MPTTSRDRELAFRETILHADEADAPDRLVFADWLNDQERYDDEFTQRWLAKRSMRPHHRLQTPLGRAVASAFSWAWYQAKAAPPEAPAYSVLPQVDFLSLPKAHVEQSHRYYSSVTLAEKALCVALKKLRDALAI